jgi:Mn-dependent DtxR family transcriptional regulator
MTVSSKARPGRDLSPSTEHYLRAILELREERGYARVVDIATRVGVTKGSVSLALTQLEGRGLIRFDPARFPQLSPVGRRIAADLRGRYTIVQSFLQEVLGLPAERASAEACRWEHVISHEVADRLLDLLRFVGDHPAVGRSLSKFRTFHRRCETGPACNACATHGPVESYCAVREPLALPARRTAGAKEGE